MVSRALFSSASDEWETPPDLFAKLHAEFAFEIDLAASTHNRKLDHWWAKDDDALAQCWHDGFSRGFCNPPYSRGLQAQFIAKAAAERAQGFTTVLLLPSRTDTRAFHTHLYDAARWKPRKGVELRFLPGRLRFVGAAHGAPFPSMVAILRGRT